MKTTAAMRCTMLRRLPSRNSDGRAHHWSGILQRESGPGQRDERNHQQRVFHPLERQHADVGPARQFADRPPLRRRRCPRSRSSLRTQSPPLCSSISPMVTGISSR